MTDSDRHEDEGTELTQLLRRNIAELRAMQERTLGDADRRRVDRLLAEAESALSEITTPEEG